MTQEQAEAAIFDAFRGMRQRLWKDGLMDRIIERMAPLLLKVANGDTGELSR